MTLRGWRRIVLPAAALSAGACATTPGVVEIVSEPPGALVVVEGYGECETPCTIGLDGLREVTVAKAGFVPQRFAIAPGAGRVQVALELAAPIEEVDEEVLPDL
ncbi:PEGA domain-containing protein [Amphiplicatus metriothermophilus]|uniref:PEGA domain-containing protein n=1 Tax=Amphiplicatus metriothermophilus TaxID=1519374 RepID=A0A239PSK8_9PROT|nr:PEGA domain-containing protein [Amphiplicatus metriothermophilus]MBB5519205.1 hypothetical protein [Amphiplicatus metriothermophilus]SNT73274.1 PEGA domain-containing protein [Amphiplicatus metriothermophilus]